MSIKFVSESTVELIKSNASDSDVAFAAWVSNFDKENLPVDIPSEYDLGQWVRLKNSRDLDVANSWYPGVEEFHQRITGLINFLYRERHMSPFEHGSFTFYIDTPIFVAREFMRHRTMSFNETSGRYKELEPRFFLIDSERPLVQKGKVGAYRFDAGSDEQYGSVFANTSLSYSNSWQAYQNMLGQGVAKEVARNVLPVGTMTQFYATVNPRNLMQFLLLRNDPNALKEIRDVAIKMEGFLEEQMPLTYAAFKAYDWRDTAAEIEALRTEADNLRKKVSQLEAEETYRINITLPKQNL